MYSTVMTTMIDGIHAIPVRVEVDISPGMPVFDMVGYLAPEVREAKERVKTALHNCGIVLPARRITVNLAPADQRKSGTGFDLAIAAALLAAMELIPGDRCRDTMMTGELNLKGQLLPVRGVLPMVSDGVAAGIRRFFVPCANKNEGRLVKEAEVFGFSSLPQVIEYLRNGSYEEPPSCGEHTRVHAPKPDFSEVNGQKFLKRAAEIAASGMHNMLFVGPPGAGKTMISERIPSILPPMTEEEQLQTTKIYSVSGLLREGEELMSERPFRSPHHTISMAGLAGGGLVPKPGEISLAHNGVLYLDELTEFHKSVLEVLRQPLEDHSIRLARAAGNVIYPADFLLLASMNPCSCGFYPDHNKCRCSEASLKRYFDRISQPLLDRMDLCVEAPGVSYRELVDPSYGESSEEIRSRVKECHAIQKKRFEGETFSYNSRIPAGRIRQFCPLGTKEEHYMEQIFQKMDMTGRTYHKILRVARTIADMEHSAQIGLSHLTEAVCYRSMDERFWGGML